MPRIFLGNFDFEYELAGTPTSRENPKLADINRRLSLAWAPLLQPGDLVAHSDSSGTLQFHDPADPQTRIFPDPAISWELVPWGWSSSAHCLAKSLAISIEGPDPEIVRHVNRRSFRFQLECELGIALPGAALIQSQQDLRAALAHIPPEVGWGLKSEFGMSGRERHLGRGPQISPVGLNWVASQLQAGMPLVFEPWLRSLREAGLLFEIPRRDPPLLSGVAELLTSSGGAYLGSRFGAVEDSLGWEPAIDVGMQIAERLQRLGYFGPLGIDAMIYETFEGSSRIRLLQDLNARLTMGRLALAWIPLLSHGECGLWLHFKQPPTESIVNSSDWPTTARVVRQSDFGTESWGWMLIAAADAEQRRQAEMVLKGI